jgi:hypothetical protein
MGRVMLVLGHREDPGHQNSELPLKERLPNHDGVIIAVVACL